MNRYNRFILSLREDKMVRLKVKEVAEAKGMSQRRLSLRSGVDINTVRRIHRNPYTVVTTETLDKLAKVLGVDVSELLESVPDNETSDQEKHTPPSEEI